MPSPFRVCRVAAVATVSLCLSALVHAQDAVPFQNLATDMMPAQMLERNLANINGGAGRTNRRPVRGVRQSKNSATHAAPAVTTYHPAPAVTEEVKQQQYLTWAKTTTPDDAAKLTQALKPVDVEKEWGKAAHETGLKSGDLIDSMAGYYVLNWAIANGKDADRPQTLAVRNQFRTMLGSVPALRHSTEAQRQMIAETMMVHFLFQAMAYRTALQTHNLDMKSRLSVAAAQRFQHEMGRDPRSLRIGSQGFTTKA